MDTLWTPWTRLARPGKAPESLRQLQLLQPLQLQLLQQQVHVLSSKTKPQSSDGIDVHWWCWLLIVKLRICHFAFNVVLHWTKLRSVTVCQSETSTMADLGTVSPKGLPTCPARTRLQASNKKQQKQWPLLSPVPCVTHLQLVPLETILICSILCLFCLLQKNCNMPIITWMRLRGNLGSRHVKSVIQGTFSIQLPKPFLNALPRRWAQQFQ